MRHPPFAPANPGGPGRPRGVRNRLNRKFLDALTADFEQHGEAIIRVCRVTEPVQYLKIVAALMPRELDMTVTAISDMREDELIKTLDHVRHEIEAEETKLLELKVVKEPVGVEG